MPNVVYTPYVQCTINGSQPSQSIVKARVESSFADPVSRGYVTFVTAPTWGHGDTLTITMGNGVEGNATRFRGTILEGDYLNSGPTVELVARGPLWRVQKYRNPFPNGLTLLDLTGGPATDQAIATAVLNVVGVTNIGSIGGTGIVRGALAAVAYTWKKGEGALEYLQRLSKASLGYKMVESTDGNIYRTQVFGRPTGGSTFTFTEGVDIFEGGHTQRSTFDMFSAWSVTGFDYGDGFGPVSFSDPADPTAVDVFTFSSEMIERSLTADPGGGISCEQVLAYVQAESDHEIVKLSGMTTPRGDLIGPGQTHSVNSPLLGVSEQLWVLGITCEVDDQWFQQTPEYIGGG